MTQNLLNIDLKEQLGAIKKHKSGQSKLKVTTITEPPPPAVIRQKLGLTQEAFAALIGISVKTLRNWEQNQRAPQGPASALLRIVYEHPEVLIPQAVR